jgi:nucleotide-binding universal stress UspA family protein
MGMERIVVGVDGSTSSVQAARFAGELAGATGAELVVIHVRAPSQPPDSPDLIVVGAHGLGAAEQLGAERLGWVSTRMAHHAHLPVLIVH